ncbi:MAG: S-layer homology domain-containing protein, partial [Clostridia bacterium]|nr:S-layer homology domain-containing protein [Clostridia bacterium]
ICQDSYVGSFVEATGHSYESVITAPTCTSQGYTTHICSRCEDSYVDNYIEPTEHSYEAVITEPTCLDAGYTTYICAVCEDSYVADETEALGHDYKLVTTAATCTEPGYTDNVCTRCGDTVNIGFISPTGHSWYYASTVEPTCTKEGITIYCCANCDATNEEPIPVLSSCPTQGYSDVPGVSNWAHEGIDFCITRGIMGSTSTARLVFEPGISCTRSMIVSILYRLSGEPDVTFEAAFPDVKAGQWYSNAVIWAYHNGVVKGYDTGKFGPNDIITREQMAVILKGYTENILQQDTSASTTLDSFADCAKVKWSKDYVSWAVAVGMISGKTQQDGTVLLDPQGNASRSEVASILMRFVQNLVEA